MRCPVSVVRTEHSELFAAVDLDCVVNFFLCASGEVLPDSGHMIMWENPDGVVALATRFLSSPA